MSRVAQSSQTITEADIRGLSSDQSFQRGKDYYRRGALFDLVRQENELRAYCEGSDYKPYRVTATLGFQGGIAATSCTCPYDWGGLCKHRVALLLAWVHEPEAFHTTPPLNELLAGRSKDELIGLIKEMLKREPDLIRLLELPVQPNRQTPLNLDAFRRQIAYALRGHDDDDYADTGVVATELTALVETAQRFAEAGDWINAGELYALILVEIVPRYGDLYDENGDVAIVLQGCAAGLESCLTEGYPDGDTRRGWLEALLAAELKDVEMGGIDLATPAGEVLINQATDEEWTWIEERVRQVLASKAGPRSQWTRESLVGFLAQRLTASGEESSADDLIFELGTPEQQAFLLVEQGHFEEAVPIAREHFSDLPGLVIQFANTLVAAGAGPAAEVYIASQLNTRSRSSYLEWLAKYAGQTGRLPAAVQWWRQSIQESPNFETYRQLRDMAKQSGQWEQLRLAIQAELTAKKAWSVLLEVALDEEDVSRALELLPNLKQWYGSNYELRVAQAAEANYPKAALDIYLRQVERLIKAQGRSNYQAAAGLLARVRNLYRRQDQADAWTGYINQLRQEYKRLPAFQDELRRAGIS